MTAPTPAELDQLAKEYLELKGHFLRYTEVATNALKVLTEKGDRLKELVKDFGSAHAEKSKLLSGLEYEAMCTYGQSSSVDAAAADAFRLALAKSAKARLLGKIFEKTIRWTMRSEAASLVRGEKLSPKLTSLWAKCILLKDKEPSLKVRPRENQSAA